MVPVFIPKNIHMMIYIFDNFFFLNVKMNVLVQSADNLSKQFPKSQRTQTLAITYLGSIYVHIKPVFVHLIAT